MRKITKITKQEAKIAAKLYISNLFMNNDEFSTDGIIGSDEPLSTDEVNSVIQNEINIIVSRLRKGLGDTSAMTSYDCITEAKRIIQERKV